MKNNIGMIDRGIRIALAVLTLVLYLTKSIDGTFAVVLLVFAGLLFITGLIGSSPLYNAFDVHTRKK